jgi:putative FmdB family regulatory protein
MPIYAYRCQNCGFAKDVLQKVSDAPLTDCPSCNQPTFKKQLTAAGFQLKGTGWYVTDFRGGSGSTSSPKKEGSEGGSSSSSDSGTSSASTDTAGTKSDAT